MTGFRREKFLHRISSVGSFSVKVIRQGKSRVSLFLDIPISKIFIKHIIYARQLISSPHFSHLIVNIEYSQICSHKCCSKKYFDLHFFGFKHLFRQHVHSSLISRQLHQNAVPRFTIMGVDKPSVFLKKFSPDGKYLFAFSSDQMCIQIFKYLVSCVPLFQFPFKNKHHMTNWNVGLDFIRRYNFQKKINELHSQQRQSLRKRSVLVVFNVHGIRGYLRASRGVRL